MRDFHRQVNTTKEQKAPICSTFRSQENINSRPVPSFVHKQQHDGLHKMIGIGVEISPKKQTIEGGREEKEVRQIRPPIAEGSQPPKSQGQGGSNTPSHPPTSSPPTSTPGTGKEFPAHHPNADGAAARKVPPKWNLIIKTGLTITCVNQQGLVFSILCKF